MKLKKLVALGLISAMTLSLVACGSKDSDSDSESKADVKQDVQLVLWGAEEDQDLLREMADEFIALHKDEVNSMTIEIGVQSESTAKDTVLTDVTAAADVYSFADDQLNGLVAAGALQEITTELYKDDVVARNVEGSIAAATYDGKLYAYPRTADNGYYLIYNKEYFSEDDVKTLDNILNICAENGKKFHMEWTSGWYLYSFFKGAGLSSDLAENGVDTVCDWNSTTNSITGVEVAQALLDIAANPGFVSLDDAGFVTAMQEGTVIAGVTGTWNTKNIAEAWGDNFGATVLPTYTVAGQQVQMASFSGYKLVGVNPHSDYVVWAAKLAEFITNEDNQTKSFEQRGNGPSNIKAAASEVVQADPGIAAQSAQAQYATVQRVGDNYWSATEAFGKIMSLGNPDGTDLQQLLDDLVDGVTAPIE